MRTPSNRPPGPRSGLACLAISVLAATPAIAAASFDPDGLEPSVPFATTASASVPEPLPAEGLRTSISAEALASLQREADEAYRAKRWDVALAAFRKLVSVQPDHAGAWLRIGNLHHRRGQWLAAASAYRKAADRAARNGALPPPGDLPSSGSPSPRDARSDPTLRDTQAKALLNLASVNLEMAEAALTQASSLSRAALDHAPSGEAIAEQALRVAERLRSQFAASASVVAPTVSASTPSMAPTVSTPIPSTARTVSAPTPSTAPAATSPTPPVIEYLRGAPTR